MKTEEEKEIRDRRFVFAAMRIYIILISIALTIGTLIWLFKINN